MLETMAKGKDPTALSLINVDLDFSEKNPIDDIMNSSEKSKS